MTSVKVPVTKNCVTILGSKEIIRDMVENASEIKRYTSLDLRIREMESLS